MPEPEPQSGPPSRHNSGHSRTRQARNQEEASEASQTAPLVVRTSQSGIIPDTQNMIGLSELIPDNKDIDPTFQAWLNSSHNRTTKSGLLVENPISRCGFSSPEAVKTGSGNDTNGE